MMYIRRCSMSVRDTGRGTPGTESSRLDEEITRMARRKPAEIARTRSRALEAVPPARPLPPGRTWIEVISGQWPGDESDDEVRAALDELS